MSVDPLVLLYGFKTIRIATSYISATITSNFMAQVYMDKVLINQENPQNLTNFVLMFCIIDAIICALLLGVFSLSVPLLFSSDTLSMKNILPMLIQDYIGFIVLLGISGYIVATVMYNKKYFMYKDDGLRGIRALKDIVFCLSVLNGFVPYNLLSLNNKLT